jgi:SAM-dependent methyltransferase
VRCPVCGGEGRERVFDVAGVDLASSFTLTRCLGCAHLAIHPVPVDLARYYEGDYHAHDFAVPQPFAAAAGWRGAFKRALLSVVYGYEVSPKPSVGWRALEPALRVAAHKFMPFPRPEEGRRLLELGCGAGAQLKVLAELGWDVSGVELGADAARFARERLGLDVRQGSLESARLPAASFDFVVASHVLEHLPDPAAAAAEIARILKPGGRLYAAVPNGGALEAAAFGSRWAWEAPHHLHHFTPASLGRVLERAGLRVESERHELFSSAIDVHIALRNCFPAAPAARLRILRALYAPVGLLLAASGRGTRFSLTCRKL